jgi:hypothetical protein
MIRVGEDLLWLAAFTTCDKRRYDLGTLAAFDEK